MYGQLKAFTNRVQQHLHEDTYPDPQTIGGGPIADQEQSKDDLDALKAKAKDEAKKYGYREGTADYLEFVRDFVAKKEAEKKEGLDVGEPGPGVPAANPDDPEQTKTDKEIQTEARKRKMEALKKAYEKLAKEGDDQDADDQGGDSDPEDDDDDSAPSKSDDDEDEAEKKEMKKKTESLIVAVLKGGSPKKIVESLFRR